jgi:hypothetical protein
VFARNLLTTACALFGLDQDRADDIKLMGSELAANSTEHAPAPYELRLYRLGDRLVCEVANAGDQRFSLPCEPSPILDLEDLDTLDMDGLVRGRGLSTISSLSKGRCGIRNTSLNSANAACPGIAAWFEIPLPNQTETTTRSPHIPSGAVASP